MPRQEQAVEGRTARRLLAAAEWIVLRRGVAQVSIRSIATRARVNSALISYYFKGLAPLLEQLALANVARITAARSALLAQARDDDEERRFERLIDAYTTPLWAAEAAHHAEPARAVVRALLPALSAASRRRVAGQINQSVGEAVEALAPLLPQLSRRTLLLRLRLLAGAAEMLQPQLDAWGLFPMLTSADRDTAAVLKSELLEFARGALHRPAAALLADNRGAASRARREGVL